MFCKSSSLAVPNKKLNSLLKGSTDLLFLVVLGEYTW